MAAREYGENFSMRVPPTERDEWTEGARLLAQLTGAPPNVSAFLRLAAREKLARLRAAALAQAEPVPKKKGGRT